MTAQRETDVPSIPELRDDNVKDVLRAIKSMVQVREGTSGDPLDAFVTYRHLETLGLAESGKGDTKTDSGDTIPVTPTLPVGLPGGYNPRTDLKTPPAPTNLIARGVFTLINLQWDGASYSNPAYTEIWRSATDNINTAILIGTTVSNVYADPVDYGSVYYYWVRFVSAAGIKGPYNATAGTRAETGVDIGKAIEAISKQLIGSPLWQDLTSRIDQIEADAYIKNRGQDSTLEELSKKTDTTTSRIVELNMVSATQATQLTLLESKGPGNGSTIYFTPERPDAFTPGAVDGIPLGDGDIWYDTNDANRSYRWTGSAWVEFTVAGAKVYHQPTDPASQVGGIWQDASGRALHEGDMWYDSDSVPPNHPWRWNSATNVWADFTGDASAEIITLEQTKIGYATLNRTSSFGLAGTVFDNGGAIWNNVGAADVDYIHSVQYWNSTHVDSGSDSKLTWHVGLPFAQATKQIGVTTPGGSQSTLQQELTVLSSNDASLLSQYTLKIDSNGYVAGFGLAVYDPNVGPTTSAFIVNADTFGIGPAMPSAIWGGSNPYNKNDVVKMSQTTGTPPVTTWHVFQARQNIPANSGHKPTWGAWKVETDAWWMDLTARLPFLTTTIAQTIDGITYQPGVWINVANIGEASIISAKIESLDAQKISTGTLFASISVNTGMIYGGVNPASAWPTYPPPNDGSNSFGTGYFLGNHGSVHKFFVGDANTNFLSWDGSGALNVAGSIYGYAGRIGGINMAMTVAAPHHGSLYTNNVTGFNSGATGIYMDDSGLFRVGIPNGRRMAWDGNNLTIYGDNNKILLSSGSGIDWGTISGTPPANVANASITINADGTLTGAGGSFFNRVTPEGIQAVNVNGSNAPPGLVNTNIQLGGGSGVVQLYGGSGGVVRDIIMPGFRIGDPGNSTGTYIADVAIDRAQIANLAVGGAQIAYLAVGQAQMAYLNVTGLQIDNEAVVIPRVARGFPGSEQAVTVLGGWHDNAGTQQGGYQILMNGHYGICSFTIPYFPPPVQGLPWPPDAAQMQSTVVVTYNASIVQQNNNSGCKIMLECVLSNTDGDWQKQTFEFGIINNSPKFAQSAVFVFEGVMARTNGWWLRLQAFQPTNDPRVAFNAQQWTNFYDQVMTVQVMKR